jgi:hypothetical protein
LDLSPAKINQSVLGFQSGISKCQTEEVLW